MGSCSLQVYKPIPSFHMDDGVFIFGLGFLGVTILDKKGSYQISSRAVKFAFVCIVYDRESIGFHIMLQPFLDFRRDFGMPLLQGVHIDPK